MKVEYEKTMMDRLLGVKHESMVECKVIKCVRLCKEEWKRLEVECQPNLYYSWHDFNVAKRVTLLGMRVEYSDESMSTVCHEYEDTGYPSMIRDLEKKDRDSQPKVADVWRELRNYKESVLNACAYLRR